ncbi:MAG: VIT1/CCC1 transporter family protein [Spirochaetota bacterium]
MTEKTLPPKIISQLLVAQKNEITEYHIYDRLSSTIKDRENGKILKHISDDELRHYNYWKSFTNRDVSPNRVKLWYYVFISRIFGITFGLKLMERGEDRAQVSYDRLAESIPGARNISKEEHSHEEKLLGMIKEERLNYAGSIVLGLNDALVELTGALAGLSFALQKTDLIAVAGLITGIAASLSMAASEYLSKKTEGDTDNALKSSLYTGIAYIVTVVILVLPYFLLDHYLVCLAFTLIAALLIIFLFNYYISVAQELNFRHRFFEMAGISMGVALLSFGIGFLVRTFLGVDV